MKIAIFQMNCVVGDLDTNLNKILSAAQNASAGGAELLIVPELALTGYGAGEALQDKALSCDDVHLKKLCAASQDLQIAMVVGYSQRDGETCFNSAALISQGKLQANYHKCQLWAEYERSYFEAGAPCAIVAEHSGLRIGMLICYDVEFPERVRALAKAGVDLIAVPTATAACETATFIAEKVISVRAFENQSFIAYVNHHGYDGKYTYAGLSCVAAPDGSLLAQAEIEGDALLYCDITPETFDQHREELPYLNDLVEG